MADLYGYLFQIMCGLNPLCFYWFDTMSYDLWFLLQSQGKVAFQGISARLCRALFKSVFMSELVNALLRSSHHSKCEVRELNVSEAKKTGISMYSPVNISGVPVCVRHKKRVDESVRHKTQRYKKSTTAEIQFRFL